METVAFIVPGQPVPKQRARKGRNGWYTPRETEVYADNVVAAWQVEGRPVFGDMRVSLRVQFFFQHSRSNVKKNGEPRKGAPKFPPRVDIDNLVKAILDPLEGRLFDNDCQVVSLVASKQFDGDEPRAELFFAAY